MRWRNAHYLEWAGVVLVAFVLASLLFGTRAVSALQTRMADPDTHNSGSDSLFSSYDDFVRYVAGQHKAPFSGNKIMSEQQLKQGGWTIHPHERNVFISAGTNSKVNQDHNPWAKTGAAVAVSPVNSQYVTVVTHDFRQNFDHLYYHFTTDGGVHWSDDAVANGYNTHIEAPYDFQSDPGVAIDRKENSFISMLSGNLYYDIGSGYANFDTEINLAQGHSGGAVDGMYTNVVSTMIDYVPCHGVRAHLTCPGQLDKPFVTVDTVESSPNKGMIYVYYTYICNGAPRASIAKAQPGQHCSDGKITIPASSSAILESHSSGVGQPFSPPKLVSGSLTQAQFSSMVIDSRGGAHIFFDDFSHMPTIHMYEATLGGNGWSVNMKPVVGFRYGGLNNSHWNFRDSGTMAPGCSIRDMTAYCAFSAAQVGAGKASKSPDVYLATVRTGTGETEVHQVNNDAVGAGKDHFFPWTTVDGEGKVYVGWFDNRNNPGGSKVEYFVGMSSDGGKTFPHQQAVSDIAFNPCNGFPGCFFFGDYYQLVADGDNGIHATWADTRDGNSMQMYSQVLKWEP